MLVELLPETYKDYVVYGKGQKVINLIMLKVIYGMLQLPLLFLEAQGYDNHQSAMKIKNNGKQSMGKRTRHLDIRYFFLTSAISRDLVRVEYCPTDEMTADCETKPLQDQKFVKFRGDIMNLL